MLTRFQRFDAERFFSGKKFLLTKIEPWQEGNDSDHLRTIGSKISGVIAIDETVYSKLNSVQKQTIELFDANKDGYLNKKESRT